MDMLTDIAAAHPTSETQLRVLNPTPWKRALASFLFLLLTPVLSAAASRVPGDIDDDGIPDEVDNCSEYPNPAQLDIDGDGFGNACDGDFNGDDYVDFLDLSIFDDLRDAQDPLADLVFEFEVNDSDADRLQDLFFMPPGPGSHPGGSDVDADGIISDFDNCSEHSNVGQIDIDGDGFGNACDADFNGDDYVDFLDSSIFDDLRDIQDLSADLAVEHVVDDTDANRLQELFFAPPGPGAVPEPSETLLATAALLTLTALARRRNATLRKIAKP